MQGTPRGLREDLEARLAQLEQRAPEWRSWLDLLRETVQAGADPIWDDALGAPGFAAEPGRVTPLLEGAVLRVGGVKLGGLDSGGLLDGRLARLDPLLREPVEPGPALVQTGALPIPPKIRSIVPG